MSEIDDQIARIKAKIDAGRIAKARADATRENAQAAEDSAMARLKEEFGVDSIEEARGKLGELQAEVNAYLKEITDVLDEIEI